MGYPDLKNELLRRYPWLAATDHGPQSVDAGECDRCRAEARLVSPCGPPPEGAAGPDWGIGRHCAAELGVEAWCEGHEADGRAALEWLEDLPPEADDVARLWWVSTGEVRLDPALIEVARRMELPAPS